MSATFTAEDEILESARRNGWDIEPWQWHTQHGWILTRGKVRITFHYSVTGTAIRGTRQTIWSDGQWSDEYVQKKTRTWIITWLSEDPSLFQ